jgi:hypothetical protein
MKYAIGYAPVSQEIQVGRQNKAGTMFLEDKERQTNNALLAVCQLVLHKFDGEGELVGGGKRYTISVTEERGNDHE